MSLSAKPDMKVTATEALDYDGQEAKPKRRKAGPLIVFGLTLTACALVAWLVYGEQILALLHAGGEVPVVRADAGPVKVRPEQPGGMEVPNRDKLVYERLEGGEGTSARVERLLPRPEEPLPRSAIVGDGADDGGSTDAAAAPTAPQPSLNDVPDADTVAKAEPPEQAPPPPTSPPETASGGADGPTRLLPKDASGAEPAPSPDAAPAGEVEQRPMQPQQQAARQPAEPAPTAPASPEPAGKPAKERAAPPPTETAATAPGASFQDAYRVQLLAARSESGAEAEWRRIRGENQDLLGDLALNVTRVDLGADKGIFYRVRVGPLADETAAKTLCTRLKQRKQGCLVVRPGG